MCDARPKDTGLCTTYARDDECFEAAAADQATAGFACRKAADNSLELQLFQLVTDFDHQLLDFVYVHVPLELAFC